MQCGGALGQWTSGHSFRVLIRSSGIALAPESHGFMPLSAGPFPLEQKVRQLPPWEPVGHVLQTSVEGSGTERPVPGFVEVHIPRQQTGVLLRPPRQTGVVAGLSFS